MYSTFGKGPGLQTKAAQYASSPHLHLYQSDNYFPEPIERQNHAIYCSAHEINKVTAAEKEKEAVKKITEKYDSLKRMSEKMQALQVNDYNEQNLTNGYSHQYYDEDRSGYHHNHYNGHYGEHNGQHYSYDGLQNGQVHHPQEIVYQGQQVQRSSKRVSMQKQKSAVDEVNDADVFQIETFFKGHKTKVFVCRCLANLYMRTVEAGSSQDSPWDLKYTGVPVLILDSGDTKSRDKRILQIMLSEKGTGFMLWKDTIDNLTGYKAPNDAFHTLYLSSDHSKLVGLSFDRPEEAQRFLKEVETLTADPANIRLSGPRTKKQKKEKKKPQPKWKPPSKSEISNPCYFQHVTCLDPEDCTSFYSLQAFVSERNHVPKSPTIPLTQN